MSCPKCGKTDGTTTLAGTRVWFCNEHKTVGTLTNSAAIPRPQVTGRSWSGLLRRKGG